MATGWRDRRRQRPDQEGGTLNYAADQEPAGFNNNTSKDNGTSVANVTRNVFPVAFNLTPDFKVQMNKDLLLESAEQTNEDPQTIVYKIKQNAVWSDDTPITADDFIYLWENSNGTKKDNDVAATTGYDQMESVTGSDNGKTVTVVYKTPFVTGSRCSPPAPTSSRPLHGEAAGRLEHRPRQEPPDLPLGGWFKIENWTAGQA